jgi:hypothetical protein
VRLAVIDASPIGGGPVTRALDVTAGEVARNGGVTDRVRLYDLFVTACSRCTSCASSGRCACRVPALDSALDTVTGADALLVGTPGHLHARDPRCDALLRRLVGAFAAVETRRGFERHNSRAGAHKFAALVTSAPPLLGMAAVMGILPVGLGSVWHVLDRAGVEVVGCASVATRWIGPAERDATRDRARHLGRALAAAAVTSTAPAPVPEALPAAAAPIPVMRTA